MNEDYMKDPEAIARLTPHQYSVTQESATEPAFRNEFWDHHEAGLYVDIVSGEPLFTSTKKFDSGCGWPSFTAPIESEERDRTQGPQLRHDAHGSPFDQRRQSPGPRVQRRSRRTRADCDTASTPRRYDSSRTTSSRPSGYGDYKYLFDNATPTEEASQ